MSAEEAVTDALQQPLDKNAAAAEDAKKMLAELQGEFETNGKTEEAKEDKEAISEAKKDGEAQESTDAATATEKPVKEERSDKRDDRDSERRRHDRSERSDRPDRRDGGGRGGRGRGRGDRGGDRGRGGHASRNFKDNIKSDVSTAEVTDDPVAIRKQVEFYFSDSNLPKDQFLFNKVGGSKNEAVELSVLHSFKRMRRFQPFEAIVAALKESTFLELTDDDTAVKRREPLPEALDQGADADAVKVFEDRAMPRSVYVKGFGEEVPSTQFDIEAFFAPYGPTNAVRLRRSDTKLFKGSVFVEFENEELAKSFLELDPKPQYNGKDLQVMSKKEYCDKKVDDIKSGKIRPNRSHEHHRRGSSGGGGDRRGGGRDRDFKRKRDDEDDRDWRKRREDDQKNGFRDNRGGGRGRGGRDSRGGRSRHENRTEKDERGIPVVKNSADDETKSKRDVDRADAIAKAKAVVDAENKKEAGGEQAAAAAPATDAPSGTKRAREDDAGDEEREVKKVDAKPEAVEPINGS